MDVIILVALWCGQPSYNRLQSQTVNECRARVYKCFASDKKNSNADVFWANCLAKEQLGGG